MGKPIFALTLEEARAELLRAAPRTWRQDMLRVRIPFPRYALSPGRP